MRFFNRLLSTAIGCLVIALSAPAQPAGGPSNLDFEEGQAGQPAPGWITPVGVAAVSDKGSKQGKQCVTLACGEQAGEGSGVGNLMQGFDAKPFRGKRVSFKAFVRLDAGRSKEPSGSGLGLAIARSIVEAHGGALTLRSAPEGGSRLTIRLPRS